MSFITALGGLSQGVSQGIQDLNTQKQQKALEEQQAFQRTQNQRLLDQQAEEARVNQQLKGLAAPVLLTNGALAMRVLKLVMNPYETTTVN